MLSKNKIKWIRSLASKKKRDDEGLFVAEGPKIVGEMLPVFEPVCLLATEEWIKSVALGNCAIVNRLTEAERVEVSQTELKHASMLQHPQQVLAVFRKRARQVDTNAPAGLSLALDDLQDPGNLGTIIRIADWFGIEHIFCSHHTADVYSPKVVQAAMGSLARVMIDYIDLEQFLDCLPHCLPVYGTALDGDDIYSKQLTRDGIIIVGNEGQGVSPALMNRVTYRLRVPSFPRGRATADSLNVAAATAIVCSEFRRNSVKEKPSPSGTHQITSYKL